MKCGADNTVGHHLVRTVFKSKLLFCRKLSTHQLPWGWYQACYWSLWLFAVLMPITVSLYAEPKWTTWTKMLSSVLIVAIYATLHEVANYTEEPVRC